MSICFKQKTWRKSLVSASSWLQGDSSFRSVMILLQSAPDPLVTTTLFILLFHDLVCQIFKKLSFICWIPQNVAPVSWPLITAFACSCAWSIAMPEKDLLVLWITNFPAWKASVISGCLVHPKSVCLSGWLEATVHNAHCCWKRDRY